MRGSTLVALALIGCAGSQAETSNRRSDGDAGALSPDGGMARDGGGGGAGTSVATAIDSGVATGWTWQSVNIQGMGYATGLVVHPDTNLAPDTTYVRTDVGGAYRFDTAASRWLPLLDAFGQRQAGAFGVESIAVDPSVADDVYVAVNGPAGGPGQILVSHDRGGQWADTGPIAAVMMSNNPYRGSTGERLVVDPQKSGLLYFGSRTSGLFRKDGAGAWSNVAGGLPPAADPGCTFVVFDPVGGRTPDGASAHVFVGIYGFGVYASTDGGASFGAISQDANPTRAVTAADGTLYVSFGGSETMTEGPGAVREFASGSWTDITPPSGTAASYSGITVSVSDPSTVMVTTNSAQVYRSSNRGDEWQSVPLSFVNVPSYTWESTWYVWGSAALVIDPNDSTGSTVWRTDGWGVSRTTVRGGAWSPVMNNFEELVASVVKTPPVPNGPQVVVGAQDAMGFAIADPAVLPSQKIDPEETDVADVTSIDYCASAPESVAYVGWDEEDSSVSLTGMSSDTGRTFAPFADTSPGRGGVIAISASDPANLVWAPTDERPLVYSTDSGASWSTSAGPSSESYYRSDAWFSGQSLAADRVQGGSFYYIASQQGTIQLWHSHDGGASFQLSTATFAGAPTGTMNPRIKANPTVAGDVWIAFGFDPSLPVGQLYRSTDGGTSISVVPTVDAAYLVGFGKGPSPATPAVYILGRMGGANADVIYRSNDLGNTWSPLSDPALQQFGVANDLDGDLLADNVVYVGLEGRGFMYGHP
jgi:xyloglucan-specific exo-beta-1,4-glucanase